MSKADKILQFDMPREIWRPAEDVAHGAAEGLLSQYRAHFPALEDQIDLLLARGTSLTGIQRQLTVLYGINLPTDAIASYADAALLEARDWAQRALDPLYPIVVFDRMRIKLREAKAGRNRTCLLALGMCPSGAKEVLGVWLDNDDETLWPAIMQDLRLRGAEDVLIFVSPEAKSSEAMAASFADSDRLICIVELLRRSLEFASSQNRAAISAALKTIYCAADAQDGLAHLQAFAQGPWGRQYPVIAALWLRDWSALSSLFALPVDIRRIVASTFAMDGLQRNLRRAVRARGEFANADDALALLALVSRSSQRHWKRPHRDWHRAKTQLALRYPTRFSAQ